MSPFWKNVNDEMQYQGMNLKTLSFLTGIPYTTITNGRNRPNSIPSADVAVKISKTLGKSLEWLLGEDAQISTDENSERLNEDLNQENILYKKHRRLIEAMEKLPAKSQSAITEMAVTLQKDFESAE